MWLRKISSCSCLTVLPGSAWVLQSCLARFALLLADPCRHIRSAFQFTEYFKWYFSANKFDRGEEKLKNGSSATVELSVSEGQEDVMSRPNRRRMKQQFPRDTVLFLDYLISRFFNKNIAFPINRVIINGHSPNRKSVSFLVPSCSTTTYLFFFCHFSSVGRKT